MKSFFKKYPEVVILSILVIIIDSVIIYMWRGEVNATAIAAENHTKLDNDAKAIINSSWRVSQENANIVNQEVAKWQETFNELLSDEQIKYKLNIEFDKSKVQGPQAKQDFKNKIEKLSQDLLKEKDKTDNNLSFKTYAYENTILKMAQNDIQTIFEVLKSFEELVNICVAADIISLDRVNRPKELQYEIDPVLSTKRYTFELNFTADAESLKKFLNMVTQNDQYFFDILSCKIEAENQVTVSAEDILPLIPRLGSAINKATNTPAVNLNKLPETLLGETTIDAIDQGPVIINDSISPFNQAIYSVTISLDWVQFVKEK